MPSNTAAWLVAAKQSPLEVKEAPYTSPAADEIVIKNAAVAINPVDMAMQTTGRFPLNYPHVLGLDVSGEVVEVGSDVSRFRLGDRVVGSCAGRMMNTRSADGGFQTYTVVKACIAAPIPAGLSFVDASVIPLGLIVAAVGLFSEKNLGLQNPSLSPTPTGQTVLIWGGATSVGCNAIQLAVAAGYEVITTASPKNFDLMRKLGASQAFDYGSEAVVDDIVAALKGKKMAGALDAAGKSASGGFGIAEPTSSFGLSASVLQRVDGGKFIASTQFLPETLPEGITSNFIMGSDLCTSPLAKVIFEDYLPLALSEGKFVPAPDAQIVGHGLEVAQQGLDLMAAGVSAKKLVITL